MDGYFDNGGSKCQSNLFSFFRNTFYLGCHHSCKKCISSNKCEECDEKKSRKM